MADPAGPDRPDRGPELVLGLVASPGAATELAGDISGDLPDRIGERVPGRWAVRLVSERLVERPADLIALVEAARRRLVSNGWQLVCALPFCRWRRRGGR